MPVARPTWMVYGTAGEFTAANFRTEPSGQSMEEVSTPSNQSASWFDRSTETWNYGSLQMHLSFLSYPHLLINKYHKGKSMTPCHCTTLSCKTQRRRRQWHAFIASWYTPAGCPVWPKVTLGWRLMPLLTLLFSILHLKCNGLSSSHGTLIVYLKCSILNTELQRKYYYLLQTWLSSEQLMVTYWKQCCPYESVSDVLKCLMLPVTISDKQQRKSLTKPTVYLFLGFIWISELSFDPKWNEHVQQCACLICMWLSRLCKYL